MLVTDTQVEAATRGELQAALERIEQELVRRELEEREEKATREVVETKHTPKGSYQLELVDCGKDRCKKCAKGPSHGPYWYHYFRRGGRLTSRYIGKNLPPEVAG